MALSLSVLCSVVLGVAALMLIINNQNLRKLTEEQENHIHTRMDDKDKKLKMCKESLDKSNAHIAEVELAMQTETQKVVEIKKNLEEMKIQMGKMMNRDKTMQQMQHELEEAQTKEQNVRLQLREAEAALDKLAKEKESGKLKKNVIV
ncbi:uncharacterized protein LOC121870235 isoform X2 [Homarus americanus]|uniref:uncharacterized protein LOC121870235 isoform X2 n=1 Tax=Homarus americanus TaxID=6706 RepID=UPI001C444E03|nr:uncharacterized protein LOC121870235 isoform X2 [Homarus americanus]